MARHASAGRLGLLGVALLITGLGTAPHVRGEDAQPATTVVVVLREALGLAGVGTSARWAVRQDPVEARIVAGTWAPPQAGDTLAAADGSTKTWAPLVAGKDGAFEGKGVEGGAYLSFHVPSAEDRVLLLRAVGHDFVYVNGALRAGDPYGYGWLRLPVLLRRGDNEILFRASRGRLSARLEPPPAPVFLVADDATLPDPRRGGGRFLGEERGAAVVVNATTEPFKGFLEAWWTPDAAGTTVGSGDVSVPALTTVKVPFRFPCNWPDGPDRVPLHVALRRRSGPPLSSVDLEVHVVAPTEVHRRTFSSRIDGSVQYYAVNPPPRLPAEALILSLHGASVEALGQAKAYASKPFEVVVCPTNRRPFGFDWEDWGRWDAMEVLSLAWETLLADKSRVYLTGHSMGGHGTWQLGVLAPDRFAAIGPSAGWISFGSYAGGPTGAPKDDVEAMLRRAASSSDTMAYVTNLEPMGVYALHGDADTNVPVAEMRTMLARLAPFHRDVRSHEQPGADHWWDLPDTAGTDCVDWPPMFDFFARHRLPAWHDVHALDFTTPSPSVRSSHFWLSVVRQERSLRPTRVRLAQDLDRRRFTGSTENAAALAIHLDHLPPGKPVDVELDGTRLPALPWPGGDEPVVRLEKGAAGWSCVPAFDASLKGPERAGPFKEAFDRRFVLVHGTQGTPEENAWALAKARYDAETWYCRANGSVDVLSDVAFLAADTRDRSVVLYGHAQMNAAWAPLLAGSPVEVRRGRARVGARTLEGADLACLFVRPRPGSDVASVAVVAGTGMPGLRLCDRMPYFVSGIGFPDLTVFSTAMLVEGAEGVRGAGFFGSDWSVEKGEWAWR